MKMIVISLMWTITGAALHSLWSERGRREAEPDKTRLYGAGV